MFTLRQYLTTLADTHGLTKTLGGMEVCRDSRGRMCYTVGNSAIVFRVRHEGRIRSLRCYMHPPRHLAEIYGERLLPQELYLYDSPRSGVWVDVVLGDWIEGTTLHEAVAEAAAAEDTARLRQLAAAFDRLAAGLTSDDWAHGDLKPENIVVDPSGRLHLIDLDAMYLPAFAGEASPELGTAAFQHPARTIRDFNASLDDYPAALISTALHALALDPALYVRYPDADGLLFSPQQIRTDEALREAIALFEGEGLAVQYRIARLLYAPTPHLFGLPELLACAARAGEIGRRRISAQHLSVGIKNFFAGTDGVIIDFKPHFRPHFSFADKRFQHADDAAGKISLFGAADGFAAVFRGCCRHLRPAERQQHRHHRQPGGKTDGCRQQPLPERAVCFRTLQFFHLIFQFSSLFKQNSLFRPIVKSKFFRYSQT